MISSAVHRTPATGARCNGGTAPASDILDMRLLITVNDMDETSAYHDVLGFTVEGETAFARTSDACPDGTLRCPNPAKPRQAPGSMLWIDSSGLGSRSRRCEFRTASAAASASRAECRYDSTHEDSGFKVMSVGGVAVPSAQSQGRPRLRSEQLFLTPYAPCDCAQV